MSFDTDLALNAEFRPQLWQRLATEIERYLRQVGSAPVAPALDPAALRALLAGFDFAAPAPPLEALSFAVRGLWEHQVHTSHPRYFGLFNPAPTTMGIAADALVAAFNPQIAAWSHSPFAAEVERHLVRAVGQRFGYDPAAMDGVFTTGGAEANHTALLCALAHAFPEFARGGARTLPAPPAIYVSSQSHHSILKAARLCGLGTDCVRVLEVDAALRLDPAVVAEVIAHDRAAGLHPRLLVATAGSTGAGAVDPIAGLATMAAAAGLWFHVDAAWGGLAAVVPELRPVIAGIERADSITFDAHKSLSVPMGAGMFLTRHPDILGRAFRVGADYMPHDAESLREEIADPYAHSIQWSRRFIGLKLFLSLAAAGWEGYAAALRHQAAMADLLRHEAAQNGWFLPYPTPLPLVLLAETSLEGDPPARAEAIVRAAVASGEVWVSATSLPGGRAAIRVCITNFRTQPDDVRALLACLARSRRARTGNGQFLKGED